MAGSKQLKPFPTFATDEEAEEFVATANLTEYDFSGFKRLHFEFEPKPAIVATGIPQDLPNASEPGKKTA